MTDPVNEEHAMEWEVLESIYSIDENFKKITENRLQYKFGTDSDKKFLVEIEWPPEYPNVVPVVNMDVFYNFHLTDKTRRIMKEKILAVAKENEGMAVSFTLIEYVKEHLEEFCSDWETAVTESVGELKIDDEPKNKKDEPMTKSAKRRMWERNDGGGLERGHDWVDILKHLAQTKSN